MARSLPMSRFLALIVAMAFVTGTISGMFGAFLISPIIQSSFFRLAPAPIMSDEQRAIDVVKRASPAVVAIDIRKAVSSEQQTFTDLFNDPFFPFLSPAPAPKSKGSATTTKELVRIGGGSGFFVTADGLVVTNRHVVEDAEAEYQVVTQDGKKLPAKVLALDPTLDLAILKVEGKDFPYLALGDSDKIEVGQSVLAIGYAMAEFQNSVTRGIISGINRRVEAGGALHAEVIEEALQTDAAINPGNSGGPLIDLNGKVLGMNTAVSQNGQSLGFALPVNLIKRSVESVQKVGRIVRPWIGVRYIQIDEAYAKREKLAYTYGALILRGDAKTDLAVVPGSPADKAGLREDDILLELNGQKLDADHSLASVLSRFAPGDKITLKVASNGKEKDVALTLEERKP